MLSSKKILSSSPLETFKVAILLLL
ncbi:hypothetical protein YPPY14_2803, partial [Yersinia pestis PY-14]